MALASAKHNADNKSGNVSEKIFGIDVVTFKERGLFPPLKVNPKPIPPEESNSGENQYMTAVGEEFTRCFREQYSIPQYENDYFTQRKVECKSLKIKPIPWAPYMPDELKIMKKKRLKIKLEPNVTEELDPVERSLLELDKLKNEFNIKTEGEIKQEPIELNEENEEQSEVSDEEEHLDDGDFADYANNYFDNGEDDDIDPNSDDDDD